MGVRWCRRDVEVDCGDERVPAEAGVRHVPLRTLRAEQIAREFHETYERLAPTFGYETRPASRVGWEKVPDRNQRLMVATARELLDREVIA